jgi:cytoskeletal protein RodZ
MTDQPYVMSPRQRRLWWIAVMMAVVALVGVGVWLVRAHQTFSHVTVTPKSLQCDGKDIPARIIEDEFDESRPPRPTYKARIAPKTECWLTVAVANAGTRAVHLDSMTFPAMMPGESGRFLLETPSTDDGAKPREIAGSGDAIFDVDQTVDAETWIELTYRIGYRADGATCPGGMSGTANFPIAHVSSAGRSADVSGSVNLIYPSVETTANRKNCN